MLVPVAVDSPRRYTGAMNAIDERACGKPGCDNFGKPGLNIVGHGWFVTKSGRRRRYRSASRLNAALLASEDSETLNTSFVERLNLTIRQGSAYLRRRSPCHARGADQLRGHVELLRCYYNFIRPHRALRFGRETRTPAMQAGLVSQRLALRDIFTAGGLTRRIFVAVVHVSVTVQPTESDEAELSTRCSPSARRQAA